MEKRLIKIFILCTLALTISFTGEKELSLVDENGALICVPGEVEISVGGGQPSASLIKTGSLIQRIVPVSGDKKVLEQ